MKNNNLIILEGNLTREPKSSKSEKGNTVIKFSIACNGYGTKSTKNENTEIVSFFDVIAWSELAESNLDKLKKGVKVQVIGSLSQWRWKDELGKSRSKVNVIAKYIEYPFSSKRNKYF